MGLLHVRYKKAICLHWENTYIHASNQYTDSMQINSTRVITTFLLFPLITFLSCNKLPETSFTYSPTENPEAGEYVQFENTTPEASSFAWDFGDGNTSKQENPQHQFTEPGSFTVKLTASNDAGDQAKSETIVINEPTILAFQILDSTGMIPLSGAEVWLYDNQADWDNFEEPMILKTAGASGEVQFENMEPIVYYIWAFKDESDGFWASGGYTPAIAQNEISAFSVPCFWVPAETAKASRKFPVPKELGRN